MRDAWSEGHLVLVVDYAPGTAGVCERHVFVATGKEEDREIFGEWVTGQSGDRLVLTSFDAATHLSYSYDKELKACGDLIIYGLSGVPSSDRLRERDLSVLSGLADLLKEDNRLKVRVVGHRASSGHPEMDYALSFDDAKAVERVLVHNYGIQTKRIFAEGLGSQEPLADSGTMTGRAANSRIEIVAERSCQRAQEPVIAVHRQF
jgi:hypothetical protein